MRLTFLGAAGSVTGSMTLVEHAGRRVLVDCGMHQGTDAERHPDNRSPPFDPASLDAVVLTHAHLDHCGLLPRLRLLGYGGRVTATTGTRDLAGVILPDSGHLQEDAAERARRSRGRPHAEDEPLYNRRQAEDAVAAIDGHAYDQEIPLCDGVTVLFRNAGHIVGSASVLIRAGDRSCLFSGDLGRDDKPIGPSPSPPPEADALVIESTYGDRQHDGSDPLEQLAQVISATAARGGVVLVPAFAVGRTQMLLYLLYRLRREGRIPYLPVWMDSPMASRATAIYRRHAEALGMEPSLADDVLHHTRISETAEESMALDRDPESMVLVSASGMVEGGRVLHHLKAFGGSQRNTILITGYQAPGTRGAELLEGKRYFDVRGDTVHVRAQVANLTGLSAHADQRQLLAWMSSGPRLPGAVFINHGVPAASAALAQCVRESFGIEALVPEEGQSVEVFGRPAN